MFLPSPTGPVVEEKVEEKVVTDADVYERAAEVLDERGWARSVWQAPAGQVCVLGAIGVAALELDHPVLSAMPGLLSLHPGMAERIRISLAAKYIVGRREMELYTWNDHLVWRPKAQVKKRLRQMARRERRTQ